MIDGLGMEHREGPGDGAAPVVTHDVGALDAECAHESGHVVREHRRAIGVDARWLVAPAVAAKVGRDDPEPPGQLRDLLTPGM